MEGFSVNVKENGMQPAGINLEKEKSHDNMDRENFPIEMGKT